MVTPARFERATYRLGIWRSIRLSYGATGRRITGPGATGPACGVRQFAFSGGTTGNGSGATGTPSSTKARASAKLALP